MKLLLLVIVLLPTVTELRHRLAAIVTGRAVVPVSSRADREAEAINLIRELTRRGA